MKGPDAAEILAEVTELLRAAFALEAWGRLLVYMADAGGPGAPRWVVSDLQVEEVLDDAAVDRAFSSDDVRGALPAIGTAVMTLAMLDGVDVSEVGGGTFVRTSGNSVGFLPGPVRTPSRSFDIVRHDRTSDVARRNRELVEGLGTDELGAIRCDTEACAFRVDAPLGMLTGKAIVVGSFSRPQRSWVWGAHNPTLGDVARRESAALLDHASDRAMWEIATPGFHTDEVTAWALAATLVVDRGLAGLVRVEQREGAIFVALADVQRTLTARGTHADP